MCGGSCNACKCGGVKPAIDAIRDLPSGTYMRIREWRGDMPVYAAIEPTEDVMQRALIHFVRAFRAGAPMPDFKTQADLVEWLDKQGVIIDDDLPQPEAIA